MALPVDNRTAKAAIRNTTAEFAEYFKRVHGENHFHIWNISEITYNIRDFPPNSITDAGWPDHHNPPVGLMFYLCHSMLKVLTALSHLLVHPHAPHT
jgi:hypothetical protein